MEPPLFEELAREFTAEVNRQRSIAAKEKSSLQEEVTRVAKQIDRLVEVIIAGCRRARVERKAEDA